MRELMVSTLGVGTPEGRERQYTYSVVIDEMDVGGFCCESYGVRIRESPEGETALVPHVTCSISRIDELMELLTRNTVTPAALRDVVDDWI